MNAKTEIVSGKDDKNYTDEMVAAIVEAAPFDFAGAKILGESFTPQKSARSVVAKCSSLGLDYIVKAKPAKKITPLTKDQLVACIENESGVETGFFAGLEKSTVKALNNMLSTIRGMETI